MNNRKQITGPLCSALEPLARDSARFYIPGHKGNAEAIPFMGEALRYDFTEITGADDLSHPTQAIAQSQQLMSEVYGSGATLYCAAGTSVVIQAMLTLFLQPGDKVVMVRGCHVSAVRALAFIDAEPVWVLPGEDGRFTVEDVEQALCTSGAKAVYVTSPDYNGVMADVPALAKLCKRYNAKLLVDNAHGAHLRFLPQDIHPLSLGADATADSAHKTLPCLTPASLLHLRDGALALRGRKMLNLYSSTSPSYLVMQSLDNAAALLQANKPDFGATAARLAKVAEKLPKAMIAVSDDPFKLCLRPGRIGWQAEAVNAALEKAGVYAELADSQRIIFMATPYNKEEDFVWLEKVLETFLPQKELPEYKIEWFLPEVACSVREATFALQENVAVADAIGRICAAPVAPCPPGVPLLIPGEKVSAKAAQMLAVGGILAIDVIK